LAVGQAITRVMAGGRGAARVVVGRDTRLSGPMLEAALCAGIMSAGGVYHSVGVLPTPGVAFAAQSGGMDAGVVVSASHNPYRDNGIKVFSGEGYKLSDQVEEEIEQLVLREESSGRRSVPQEVGHTCGIEDAAQRYIVFLKRTFARGLSLEGLRLVLDCANGATSAIAPQLFEELGAQVRAIHNTPDGLNINEGCGSEHTAGLRETVLSNGADVGLAFDGDGDRLVAVDEKGNELTGDQIVVICAEMLKADKRLTNDRIVTTVMSNVGLELACKRLGLTRYACKVGDRYVVEEMRRLGAVLGGEPSGHLVFLHYHTTGDGLLAALQLLAAMLKSGKPLSDLALLMDVFPQELVNVEIRSKPDIDAEPEIMRAIRRVESELKNEGRVLVRYSGTEDLCRVMVEAATVERAAKYARELAGVVKAALG
jgi:phosphoglucosamine mutase